MTPGEFVDMLLYDQYTWTGFVRGGCGSRWDTVMKVGSYISLIDVHITDLGFCLHAGEVFEFEMANPLSDENSTIIVKGRRYGAW